MVALIANNSDKYRNFPSSIDSENTTIREKQTQIICKSLYKGEIQVNILIYYNNHHEMMKNWKITNTFDNKTINLLQNELGINQVLASLLSSRNIKNFDEAKTFFRPSLKLLHDPFLMLNMGDAVKRLLKAIDNHEKILVFGDYDVDGTTSVALVYSFLKNQMNANVDYYIPDRYKEGYGISLQGVDYAEENQQSLIIALDCGIRAIDQINYANEKNIDFIICDHHQPGDEVPNASAVLDPMQKDCNYPFKGLSGCGVGFKLMQGLCHQKNIDESQLMSYLDLLTISIGADIVSLSGENRILAYHGLKILADSPRVGIKTMLDQAEFTKSEMTITDVVFVLAPRINAAGRISSGKEAVTLLISENKEAAIKIGKGIEIKNTDRKELDKAITKEALQTIQEEEWYQNSWSTVIAGESWHKGVIGIVASRLIEKYYRPTIVLTLHNEVYVGSARSIKGFDIHQALHQCSDLLDKYGGHTMAAGMSMKKDNLEEFRVRFEEIVQKSLAPEDLIPEIRIDAELNFDEITPKFYRILKQFAPFGPDNMHPVFVTRNVYNEKFTKAVGADRAHLKLHVKQKGFATGAMNGIAFGLGEYEKGFLDQELFDIVYTIGENTWNDKTTLQLIVKDIRKTTVSKKVM